jgi:hypothetical protein
MELVELVVECDNIQAVRCFEKSGFKAIGLIRSENTDRNIELYEMEYRVSNQQANNEI